MHDVIEKASVLIEALPYIRTFFGKTFVIKYGGNAMLNPQLKKAVALDLILLKYVGVNPVVVHGGGPEISRYLSKLGKESRFINGLRMTDAETMDIVQMVLVGKVNKEIVGLINQNGGRAVGLCGKDGNLIVARKMAIQADEEDGQVIDLGYVGEVEQVNPEVVLTVANQGFIPVISSVGTGRGGETYNINADSVAGALAAALKAEKLIMLTDVEGIYAAADDSDSLLSSLGARQAEEMIRRGQIQGGMIPKVLACIEAVRAGVAKTHIIDGRKEHSILLEIFTDHGVGTMVTDDAADHAAKEGMG